MNVSKQARLVGIAAKRLTLSHTLRTEMPKYPSMNTLRCKCIPLAVEKLIV
jgi:hypothetical protein